jgi:hypothetical protein
VLREQASKRLMDPVFCTSRYRFCLFDDLRCRVALTGKQRVARSYLGSGFDPLHGQTIRSSEPEKPIPMAPARLRELGRWLSELCQYARNVDAFA